MGLRRPITYLAATIENTKSYWAPVRFQPDNRNYYQWGRHAHLVFDSWHQIPREAFEFSEWLSPERYAAEQWFRRVSAMPGINVLFQLANYTWMLLALALALLLAKKRVQLVAFVPAALLFLTCIASPVNGEVRYFLPLIGAAPLLVMFTVKELRENG
jgi:hypothetical protein